jgi:hypothetical protein
MFIYLRKYHPQAALLILMLAISLVACQVFDPIKNEQVPTQDVGEELPTLLSTPTLDPSTPISTPTQVDVQESQIMLVGPVPYPSPDSTMIPWEQLINLDLITDLKWETYQGELRGTEKSSKWGFSFSYPSGWYADTNSSLIQGFVQNIPMTQGPAQSDFIKFEIMRLTDPPMIEEERALNPKDLITVKMAGEPGVLYSVTQQVDQVRQIMVIFQHDGGWLAATGYITLLTADAAMLERYSAVILNMLSSFTFAEQAGVNISATTTPGLQINLEQPFEKVAFQEGPFDFEFYLYQDSGFNQNPSITWMYSDIPGVGTHVSWVYHGTGFDNPVVESWGICPEVSPRDTYPGLKEGDSSIREGGILLPQDVTPGSGVQFVFKVETSQGTYGGVLSFLLLEGSQGVEPSNVTIYAFDEAGQTVECISDLQSSTMPQSISTPSTIPMKKENPAFPSGLSVEEHMLMDAPQVDPLSFSPVQGSQEDVLRVHQQERDKRFPDKYFIEQGQGSISVDWKGGSLLARETRNRTSNQVGAEIISGEQTIYSIQLGDSSPMRPLKDLWAYGNSWILEVVHVSQQNNNEDEVKSIGVGEIIWDGESLNEKYGYEESFGFQMMRGKPFYFFQEEGQIGFVYDGQEYFLGYTQIPHEACCSGAELNPISAENMVAFYAQRDGKWYYVEIGVFE